MKLIKHLLIAVAVLVLTPVVLFLAVVLWWASPSFVKPARPAWVSKAAVATYDDKQGWRWEQCIDTPGGSVWIVRTPVQVDNADRTPSMLARLHACGARPTETLPENMSVSGNLDDDKIQTFSVPGTWDLYEKREIDSTCPVIPTRAVLERLAAVFAQAAASADATPTDAIRLRASSGKIPPFDTADLELMGYFIDETGERLVCRTVTRTREPASDATDGQPAP